MSESGHRRSDGKSVADTNAEEVIAAAEQEEEVVEADDWKRFRTPGFQRMRLNWLSDDKRVVAQSRAVVGHRLLEEFRDLFLLTDRIFSVIRTPIFDPETGEIATNADGATQWVLAESGYPQEDYSRLTMREREQFLFEITVNLIFWQQRAADIWGEAMLAKAQWEERHAHGFDLPRSGTDATRENSGKLTSRDERYFAVFMGWYSKKADSLVRSIELLGQRLKDSLV